MQGAHKPKTKPGGKRQCRRCNLIWKIEDEEVAMATKCPGRNK
jgi:hypothetical protein